MFRVSCFARNRVKKNCAERERKERQEVCELEEQETEKSMRRGKKFVITFSRENRKALAFSASSGLELLLVGVQG